MWGRSSKQRKAAVRRTEWYANLDKIRLDAAAAEAGRKAALKEKQRKKRVVKKAASKLIKAQTKRNRKARTAKLGA